MPIMNSVLVIAYDRKNSIPSPTIRLLILIETVEIGIVIIPIIKLPQKMFKEEFPLLPDTSLRKIIIRIGNPIVLKTVETNEFL